jgi:hypothetical protein
MAYSLRLPDALDVAARSKADYLGISLNALLCVALDAYLSPSRPISSLDSSPLVETPVVVEPAKLTRAQKQALYEDEKRERKRLFASR